MNFWGRFFGNYFWASFVFGVLGIFLAFPNPVLQIPFLIFLFFLGINLIAFRARSKKEAFRQALLVSGPAYALALYWIVVPVHVYGHFPFLLALFCPVLLGFIIGAFSSAYVVLVYSVRESFSWLPLGLIGGAFWAALEFLREYAFSGFPWLVSAQAFSLWPESIQAVSVIGSFGLGMFMACAGLWLSFGKKYSVAAALVVLFLLLGHGFFLDQEKEYPGPSKDILVVQGNIEQDIKWEEEIQLKTVRKYKDLTVEGMGEHSPDLVIWPETALPFYFQESSRMSDLVRDFVQKQGIHLITGSPAYEMAEDGREYQLYNRAFWISPQGKILDYYDKEHLVPFGEYIPWSEYFPFLDRLVAGPIDFTSGYVTEPMVQEDLASGMLICYEIIFPGLVRDRVAQGANLLVNISNDAWFGETSAPEQHLHLSVLRAVEQNRFVVRSTNTGISAFIDPQGRVYKSSSLFQDATVREDIHLLDETTFYHNWHWPIHWSFVGISLLGLALHFFRRKQSTS